MLWESPLSLATLARRGVLRPGSPGRMLAQLAVVRMWGYTLAGVLRASAARYPDRTALVDEHGRVGYAELVRRTDRLARGLASPLGIRASDRVGLLCRNHTTMVELLVAAATLGADAVLINTGLSAPQVRSVAEEQRLRVICHDADLATAVAGLSRDIHRIQVSEVDDIINTVPSCAAAPPRRAGRTIVLTSGTTGTPKGAARPTPPGLAPLAAILSRIPLRAGDRMLIAAPLFHTWGLAALQLTFALAATSVLQRRFEPAATLRAIAENGTTALFAVPVMLQRLLDHDPARLRVVVSSGSALPGDLATTFMDHYGDILYNLYGSTEVSWASIATPAELRRAPSTAGRPPRGTRVAILDAAGRRAPTGHIGRIFVGNEMLFEGYTSGAGRLTRHGMLATGDVGHIDTDGLLYVDGREDDMVVSGGENVYPGEVENVIATLPEVREVAVIGVPDREYGQRLAAYVVLDRGQHLDADAVRAHVHRHLARFCVPRDVMVVPALPRNATGKVVTLDLPPTA